MNTKQMLMNVECRELRKMATPFGVKYGNMKRKTELVEDIHEPFTMVMHQLSDQIDELLGKDITEAFTDGVRSRKDGEYTQYNKDVKVFPFLKLEVIAGTDKKINVCNIVLVKGVVYTKWK